MEDKYLELKHRFAFGAVMGAFFSFTLLVFGPLSLYVTGNDEMWFSFRSLLVPVIIVAVIGFALVTLAASLAKGAIHKALCCLIFGVTLGLYIQCGFFNISYGSGVLDGSQIAWKDYTTYGAIDSAMWAACIAMPFALFMVFKRSWRHVLMIAAAFILVLQIGGLAVNVYQNHHSLDKLSHEVTTEGIYELSETDNTLVFVLNSMDADYYEDYKAAHPDITEKLDGFTEYANALGTGSDSLVSFPSMLTGSVYKKDIKYTEYIDNAWDTYNVFDVLTGYGVDTRIYADDKFFGNGAVRKVDNVTDRAQDSDAYRIIGTIMYRYTLYNAAPHYLKQLFWLSLNDYATFKSNNTYSVSDDKFFGDFEKAGGFSYTGAYDAAVRIYDLKGAEMPYRLTSDGEKDPDGTSLEEQIEGDFYCLLNMIDNLRESGKYDSARIIITADNGDTEYGQKPMLLYKDKNADQPYTVSEAPVGLFDLPPTLASAVTSDYRAIGSGKSFKDAENATKSRRRYFYRNTGSNAESRIEEYKSVTPSNDADSLILIRSYYINGGKIDLYTLGTELTFTEDESAAMYCKSGFGHTNGWRTIVRSSPAVMEIPIDQIPDHLEDLHAYFSVLNIYEETRCIIRANGEEVFNDKLGAEIRMNGLNFLIPTDVIAQDKKLTLEFIFPELEGRETDIIALTSFKIYNQ